MWPAPTYCSNRVSRQPIRSDAVPTTSCCTFNTLAQKKCHRKRVCEYQENGDHGKICDFPYHSIGWLHFRKEWDSLGRPLTITKFTYRNNLYISVSIVYIPDTAVSHFCLHQLMSQFEPVPNPLSKLSCTTTISIDYRSIPKLNVTKTDP